MSLYKIINQEGVLINIVKISETNVGIDTNSVLKEKLEINGAIKLSNTTTVDPDAGTIKWDGVHFQGFNGTSWINMDTGQDLTGGDGVTITDEDLITLVLADDSLILDPSGIKVNPSGINLNEFAVPVDSVSMGNQKLTTLALAESDEDAVNYKLLDVYSGNGSLKKPCRASTSDGEDINLSAAPNTLDSVALKVNDRILVRNQSNAKQNGIYIVSTLGSGSDGLWSRSEDFNGNGILGKVQGGNHVYIQQGVNNAGKGFVLIGDGERTIDTHNIVWEDMLGGNGNYTNAKPVPETLGGIQVGDTFNNVSIQNMLTSLLYPYQAPEFSSFVAGSIQNEYEVGYTVLIGPHTFTWTIDNDVNVNENSIRISGQNISTVSNLSNDGSQNITLTSPLNRNTLGTYTFTISGTNSKNNTFTKDFDINWKWRKFYGTSINKSLDSNQVMDLDSKLDDKAADDIQYIPGGYKYFVISEALPAPELFKDNRTQLPVSMATVDDGYDQVENDINFKVIEITNAFGVVSNYRLYRTKNVLGGGINIVIE